MIGVDSATEKPELTSEFILCATAQRMGAFSYAAFWEVPEKKRSILRLLTGRWVGPLLTLLGELGLLPGRPDND